VFDLERRTPQAEPKVTQKKLVSASSVHLAICKRGFSLTSFVVGMANDEETEARLARWRERFGRPSKREEVAAAVDSRPIKKQSVDAVAQPVEERKRVFPDNFDEKPVVVEEVKAAMPQVDAKGKGRQEDDEDVVDQEENGSYTVVHVEIVSEILLHYSSPLLTR
jgi:hypothetical protein